LRISFAMTICQLPLRHCFETPQRFGQRTLSRTLPRICAPRLRWNFVRSARERPVPLWRELRARIAPQH
jgi:hypothetical protein